MSPNLLHEYVTLVVEKIRSKKGQSGGFGEKFDIQKFKQLDGYNIALGYAQKFLDMLGQGSSRAAFLLTQRYVLKVALNDKGVAQNRAEVDVYTNPASKPVVAKVYQSDPKYAWVISELVKPLKSTKEFEQLTGIDWETFSEYVNDGIRDKQKATGAPKFIRSIIATALSNDLLRGDLAQQDFSHDAAKDVLDHYGKTPDGRVVLLDYGFTHEVWESHYSDKDKPIPQGSKTFDPSADTEVDDKAPTGKQQKNSGVEPATAAPPKKRAAGAEDFDKTRR